MKVFLVRHGESQANVGEKTDLPESIGLTNKGLQQASDFATKITDEPDLIITSSHIRTLQTAKPLMEKYPNVPREVWPIHEFTFLSPELCKNTTSLERRPMVDDYWKKCDPYFVDGEGAESFNQFGERVESCLNRLASFNYRFVVVFTHGHVIRAARMIIDSAATSTPFSIDYYRDAMLRETAPNTYVYEFILPSSRA